MRVVNADPVKLGHGVQQVFGHRPDMADRRGKNLRKLLTGIDKGQMMMAVNLGPALSRHILDNANHPASPQAVNDGAAVGKPVPAKPGS